MMIAGEVSGDMHGSGVVRELKRLNPGIHLFGVGGRMMESEGMEINHHVDSLSVMGFAEVIRHLPDIRRIERSLGQLLEERRPEIVVLIDYPGFNLRFARRVKKAGIPVLYYISPQVWAWKPGRVKKIRSLVDQVNVVFRFEVEIYENAGVPVRFVGHPLLERLAPTGSREDFFARHRLDPDRKVVGLFPGSRVQEVKRILPTMVAAARKIRESHDARIALGASSGFTPEWIRSFLGGADDITIIQNATYGLMEHADVAMVTSGTATLETAWYGTPMVIVYRTSPVTYLLGRMLVNIPHIGLVNIVRGRKVVPELIQGGCTVSALTAAVREILTDTRYAQTMREELSKVKQQLGAPGASENVARNIIALAP
ncbi:MAG: lipid-A-disaccharide synthase [Ignavibacteria bacterium]|nr:lipid-A-disaccharide synthase [Ignavibacteria bacterium]